MKRGIARISIGPWHSLRGRFLFLLATLGLVVLINAATMLWGVLFLERQLDQPMRATAVALGLLSTVKRAAGAQHNEMVRGTRYAAIGPAPADDAGEPRAFDREEILRNGEAARSAAAGLASAERLEIVLGDGVPRYLASRVEMAQHDVSTWLENGEEASRVEALDMLDDIHERIEAIESRVVENATLASSHADDMRGRVFASLAASLSIALLAGVLAVELVRRWVLGPVAELREAAERFARGEFGYRVRVAGQGEIAMLASEFNSMAGTIGAMQAERIERERMAAFGSATRRIVHNIKSPLAGIRMMAELASDEPDDPERRRTLSRVVSTVDRMNTWLKRLLDLTRPEDLSRVELSPGRWAAEMIGALEDRARASGVSLELDASGAPETASFDPGQLEQALVALVANAVDATPQGGVVRVTLWSENGLTGTAMWGIDVADTGPGVSEEAEEQVFLPYFTTKSDGNGIGLAMVRKVARDHGGEAWLRDAGRGTGAVFALRLPVH